MPTVEEIAVLRLAALLDIAGFETGDSFELDDGIEPEEILALLDEIDFERRWPEPELPPW